jgi:hypothetical protein
MAGAKKKAYSVLCEDEGHIVFATRGVVARRNGANKMGIEFDEVETCRRSPEFDQYADTGVVPVKAQIAAGWRIECQHCYQYVGIDTEDAQYESDSIVYCCTACMMHEWTKQVREAHHAQATIDAACERWPGITPLKTTGCMKFGKSVHFKFPGGTQGASWTLGDDFLTLLPDDHAAWAAFVGKPVEIVTGRER